MTLVNATLTVDAVYVLTDGAVTDEAGQSPFHSQKILPLTHLNACICLRGNALLLGGLWHLIWARRGSFADAAERLGDDYRECMDVMRAGGLAVDQAGEAYLMGWDNEAAAPEAWIAANYERPGCPAYRPKRTQGFTMDVSFCPDRIKALAASAQNPFDTSGVFDPRRDGPELIAAQSAVPGSMGGGLCHLTTIYPHRIEMEILARHDT